MSKYQRSKEIEELVWKPIHYDGVFSDIPQIANRLMILTEKINEIIKKVNHD
jgi:hypothetical protein